MLTALAVSLLLVQSADTFEVRETLIGDEKAVFATVESINTIPARARIGGTIGELLIDEGDMVEAGQVLAVVVDQRLSPQIGAINSRAAALESQLDQARSDLRRAQDLFDRGIFPQARLDEAETAVSVLENQLASARQERAVVVQQSREGDVLAPSDGRVLNVPVTAGSVVMAGEAVATIAADLYVLRLRLPERHARFINEGDEVRVDDGALTGGVAPTGFIRQVYPRVEDGRVVADAMVDGLGDFFVGERIRVHVALDQRPAIVVPADFLTNRYGVDYARLRAADGETRDIVVQRGQETPDGIEIVSGLSAGDVLVRP
ncbi:efflux RND transporter periplasmic adaptor subunit [Hyphobacterium sp. WM6]|uniref:efflux RND transporter periplasmic adaptor subunit n=1 Tax=Hyphobacterium sp. WM6 TaxID=3140243 RepID=UPI0031B6F419